MPAKQTKITDKIETSFADPTEMYKDQFVLDEKYEPDIIFHRDTEIEELISFFKTVQSGSKRNIDLTGVTGTGKTLIVQRILYEFLKRSESSNTVAAYINCSDLNTGAKIIRRIAQTLTKTPKVGFGVDGQLKTIESILQPLDALVVVLDEVDKVLVKDGDAILYTLSNNPKISLVNISNQPGWRSLITDQRVTSRMQPNQLIFAPYSSEQLFDILKYRAEKALNPSSYDQEILNEIADTVGMTSGDMRKALDLLRRSVDYTLLVKKPRITKEALKFVSQRQEIDDTIKFVKTLPPQKKLILTLVFEANESGLTPNARELLEAYNSYLKKSKEFKPLALQTMRMYLNELYTYGLATIVRGRGLGRGGGKEQNKYEVSIDLDLFREEIYNKLKK